MKETESVEAGLAALVLDELPATEVRRLLKVLQRPEGQADPLKAAAGFLLSLPEHPFAGQKVDAGELGDQILGQSALREAERRRLDPSSTTDRLFPYDA